ncbi:MAG: glycoside hydrolase family 99-like domain-containing protein [Clostridia bacterium]|nr:glycoside hydrolase family 99-like domain-containing protein [Clostridia bacterium]
MRLAKKIAAIATAAAVICTQACPIALAADEAAAPAAVVDYNASLSGKKTQPAKKSIDVVDIHTFDDDKGTEIGHGFYLKGDINHVKAEADKLGGKYLHYKKAAGETALGTKIFGTALGGKTVIDFQLALFDPASQFVITTYPNAKGEFIMNTLSVGNGTISATSSGAPIQLAPMEAGKWYDISLLYDFDNNSYSVAIDGKVIKSNLFMTTPCGTIQSFEIDVDKNAACDFGFDNLRVGYYNDGEFVFPAASQVDSDLLFENDFEGSTGRIANGTAGNVDYVTENGNTFIRANRVQKSGSCSTFYGFPTTNGDVSIEFDFRLGDLTDSTKVFYLRSPSGTFHVPLYFDGTKVMLNMGESDRREIYNKLEKDKWYHFAIKTDMANQVYTCELDGTVIGKDLEMSNQVATSFADVRIAVTWGDAGVFDVDNLSVKKIGGDVDVDKSLEYEGYDPENTEAPKLNEWAVSNVNTPEGEVYEAEKMKLTGYEVNSSETYYNGMGVTVAKGYGSGVAEFTYNGEGGYKGINIGYTEVDGAYDSRYYLYQNGKLIDWWTGQYDAVGLYERESKDYWYVEKGDKFMIRGSAGIDNSSFDYVEFEAGTKRVMEQAGELSADEQRHPSYWLSSSWDAVEDAGWVRESLTLRDVKTTASNELIRRITAVDTDMSATFQITPNEASYFDFVIGRDDKYPVRVSFEGADAVIDGIRYSNVLATGFASFVKVAVRPDEKAYDVIINGRLLAQGAKFACDIDEINIIKYISSKEKTAYFAVKNFLAEAGYVLNENFKVYPANDTALIGWEAQGRNRTYSNRGQLSDYFSREILQDSSITKTIEPQTGVITYETNILFPAKKDGVRVEIGDGDNRIALFTQGSNIMYDTGKTTGAVWENYMSNVWYQTKIVVDAANHKADFSINDFQMTGYLDIAETITKLDTVSVKSGSANGSMFVDDIIVFNGTYNDFNDVPELEVPEMAGDYNVVMLTCDMWREGHHFGNDALYPYDNRTLALGYQSEGSPESTDWETKWMVEHGITVFAPCWYDHTGGSAAIKTPRNGARLDQGFMNSKYQFDIDFALNLTYAGVESNAEGLLKNMVPYYIERYFRHPSYWKIDNKPVIINYNTGEFSNQFGVEGTKNVWELVEQACIDAGFDGIVLIGKAGISDKEGYEYSYSYGLGQSDKGVTSVIVANTQSANSANTGVGYLYSLAQGWGHEAWGRNGRKLNVPLNEFKASIEYAKNVYMPQFEGSDKPLCANTIVLDNWNEYCEGHFLAPSNIAGFGYLDMVREVFTKGGEHTDLVPEEPFDQMSAQLW